MSVYDATEQSYKNGYVDCEDKILNILSNKIDISKDPIEKSTLKLLYDEIIKDRLKRI